MKPHPDEDAGNPAGAASEGPEGAGVPHARDGARILVVDDDQDMRALLERYLSNRGFQVRTAGDAEEMRACMAEEDVDLVLLDLVLPGEDGLALARELRSGPNPGIIMVTGRGDEVDRILGLEIGADDFLAKPFNLRELLARIRSLLRRLGSQTKAAEPRVEHFFEFDGWRLDLQGRSLLDRDSGKRVTLTAQEFHLLRALVRSPNREIARAELHKAISDRPWTKADRTVDGVVSQLRRKLDGRKAEARSPIQSVRGLGYVFAAEVRAG